MVTATIKISASLSIARISPKQHVQKVDVAALQRKQNDSGGEREQKQKRENAVFLNLRVATEEDRKKRHENACGKAAHSQRPDIKTGNQESDGNARKNRVRTWRRKPAPCGAGS